MIAEDELSNLLSKHPGIKADLLSLYKNNAEVSLDWLKVPKPSLCDATPLELLDKNPRQVADLIYRLKTGDFS